MHLFCTNSIFLFARWMALPSHKEYTAMALSGSACEMLLILKDHLHNVEALLSKSLFAIFWNQLAETVNRFIFSEVSEGFNVILLKNLQCSVQTIFFRVLTDVC